MLLGQEFKAHPTPVLALLESPSLTDRSQAALPSSVQQRSLCVSSPGSRACQLPGNPISEHLTKRSVGLLLSARHRAQSYPPGKKWEPVWPHQDHPQPQATLPRWPEESGRLLVKYQHDGAACPAVLEPSGGTDQGALVSDSSLSFANWPAASPPSKGWLPWACLSKPKVSGGGA